MLRGEDAQQRHPVWRISDVTGLAGLTYGPLTQPEAARIVEALRGGRQPSAPDVPWFAVAVSQREGLMAATSTLLGSGAFWANVTNGVVVGTDPHACLVGRKARLDAEYIRWFVVGRPPENRTAFSGVNRSPAGVSLLWPRATTREPFEMDWIGLSSIGPADLSGDDALTAYLDAFDPVCETLLKRCAAPSVAMSSGLDSTFVAGSMAGLLSKTDRPIEAFVYRPLATAALPLETAWRGDEGPLADLMVPFHEGRLIVKHVVNHDHMRPLDAAAAVSQRSGLPAANPANQVWLTRLRQEAIASGANMWFVGTNGNASFSRRLPNAAGVGPLGLAGLRRRFGRMRRTMIDRGGAHSPAGGTRFLEQFGLEAPPPVLAPESREGFLEWLVRRGHSRDAAANPAATEGCLRVDPFASRRILEIAARITDETWCFGGEGRGFARRLGEGRVPDAIRFSKIRGSQGRDAWFVIRNDRNDYLRRVQLARDVPGLDGLDVDKLVAHISTWPWGQVNGPPWHHQVALDRLLAAVDFAHARWAI